jgi:hypothetical protein
LIEAMGLTLENRVLLAPFRTPCFDTLFPARGLKNFQIVARPVAVYVITQGLPVRLDPEIR